MNHAFGSGSPIPPELINLHRFEKGYLILSAMADRIRYLHINSANRETARQFKSNSHKKTKHLEPNTGIAPPQLKSNSKEQPQQSKSDSSDDARLFRLNPVISTVEKHLQQIIGISLSSQDDSAQQSSLSRFNGDSAEDAEQSNAKGGDASPPDKESKSDDESTEQPIEDDDSEDDEVETSQVSTVENGDALPSVQGISQVTTREELIDAQRPSEMVDGPLRGVGYYRTSTEEESSKNARITIDQQEPLVTAAFKSYDIESVREPIKDRAISGETFDRDGLDKIEQLAEEGEINVVVVSDIDRLGRICEKTIEFVKRLRYEHDVYIVANVRWYDVSNGDDLETFNAKAGRAEAENKKRGGRGNRGKLFKLFDHGSDSYLSWFKTIPVGCEGYDDEDKSLGIKLADDETRQIPLIALEEFYQIEENRNEYARTEKQVRTRLREELDYEYEGELNIKRILTNPIYTGRAILQINQAETHSVDKAEVVIEMEDLQLFEGEQLEMWEEVQEKVQRIQERERNKIEARPSTTLKQFDVELVDDVVAAWTLICPVCGSTSDYQFDSPTTDADGTVRQKCKCTSQDDPHYFRAPTREELEELHDRSDNSKE